MTKTIYETDISEIRTVRISCECGYAIIMPVEASNTGPTNCSCCGEKLPVGSVADLRKAVHALRSAHKEHFPKIRVIFETFPEVKS